MKNFLFGLLLVGFNLNAQTNLPNIQLSNLEGKKVSSTADFSQKDQLYVFSFCATWCTPCISELDEINDLMSEWKKEVAFKLIAISIDDSRTQKRVKPLINGKGWEFDILLDTNQDFKRALGIVNVPYLIVVKNNKIVHIKNGYVPGNELDLLEKLKILK